MHFMRIENTSSPNFVEETLIEPLFLQVYEPRTINLFAYQVRFLE